MKALTFQGLQNIQYKSIADPAILQDSDVIVKVKHCGLCGSDMHVYHEREIGCDHSTAMGHEFTGEIVEKGVSVKNLEIGDLIYSPFTTSCGKCYFCAIGLTCRCVNSQLFGWVENGIGLQGAQAEYIRVPFAEGTLIKIPESISSEEGLLLGDIFSTGYFCADQVVINAKGTYVVLGCGPVGIMAIYASRLLGAEKIIAIDGITSRLKMAEKLGASTLNFKNEEVQKFVLEYTKGIGADGILEAVGSESSNRLAYDLVRPGGLISAVGVCNASNLSFSPTEAYNKNLTYKVGRCPARYYMERLVDKTKSDYFNITDIISHKFPLSEGKDAYNLFDRKLDGCMKVVFEVE